MQTGEALHLRHRCFDETRMENRHTPPPAHPPARETRPPREDPAAGVDEDIESLAEAGGNEGGLQPPHDVGFDRVVGPEEAGLGDGLDQAEEAQLGITDEELEELTEHLREPKQ